jgi:hypothetical protein
VKYRKAAIDIEATRMARSHEIQNKLRFFNLIVTSRSSQGTTTKLVPHFEQNWSASEYLALQEGQTFIGLEFYSKG